MAHKENMKVIFLDSEREPKCPPNPDYPHGMYVDMSQGAERTCEVKIPYPAPRCGVMVVECLKCGLRNGVTVAGRPDDPRKVKLACYQHKLEGKVDALNQIGMSRRPWQPDLDS